MAQGQECTIPCDARELQAALQRRRFGDETFGRLPVIGAALLLAVASPALVLVAPVVTAVVLAGWGLLGAAAVGSSLIECACPSGRGTRNAGYHRFTGRRGGPLSTGVPAAHRMGQGVAVTR